MAGNIVPSDLDAYLRPVMVKDFRVQLRARGLSPAGSREVLVQRLKESMMQTGDYTFKNEDGSVDHAQTQALLRGLDPVLYDEKNNYQRPEGQNVGNFLTDRNTSRVLAPPGGETQVFLGHDDNPASQNNAAPAPAVVQQTPQQVPQQVPQQAPPSQQAPPQQQNGKPGDASTAGDVDSVNNYARPGGMQNVGNFLTDRNTSRVLAPPGGKTSVTFG